MNIVFEPAPTGITHFLRYASGYVVWCKVEVGHNNQLILSEWDSSNECWVPGINPVELYQQTMGLASIDDLPTKTEMPIPEGAPVGTTHCYQHGGETSWYRETEDNLFVWRDGSWYTSTKKSARDLAKVCPFGAVTILTQEVQLAEDSKDDLTWLARNVHSRGGSAYAALPEAISRADALRWAVENVKTWPTFESGWVSPAGWRWVQMSGSLYLSAPCCPAIGAPEWSRAVEQRYLSEPSVTAQLKESTGNVLTVAPELMSDKFKFEPLTSIEDNQEQDMQPDSSWFERGELPPVGTVCEYTLGANAPWYQCEIKYVIRDDGVVMKRIQCGSEQYCGLFHRHPVSFRPISTEHDHLMKILDGFDGSPGSAGRIADAILTDGFKRDGGGK